LWVGLRNARAGFASFSWLLLTVDEVALVLPLVFPLARYEEVLRCQRTRTQLDLFELKRFLYLKQRSTSYSLSRVGPATRSSTPLLGECFRVEGRETREEVDGDGIYFCFFLGPFFAPFFYFFLAQVDGRRDFDCSRLTLDLAPSYSIS
jgi:hypothetical protein